MNTERSIQRLTHEELAEYHENIVDDLREAVESGAPEDEINDLARSERAARSEQIRRASVRSVVDRTGSVHYKDDEQ